MRRRVTAHGVHVQRSIGVAGIRWNWCKWATRPLFTNPRARRTSIEESISHSKIYILGFDWTVACPAVTSAKVRTRARGAATRTPEELLMIHHPTRFAAASLAVAGLICGTAQAQLANPTVVPSPYTTVPGVW